MNVVNADERIIELEAQGASFLLLSSVLRDMPKNEWLASLAAEGVFDEIPYAADNESVARGAKLLQSWAETYDEECFDDVYADCMRLLVGPGMPKAAPWESVYSERNEGLIFQQETVDVRKAYRAFGLQVDKLHQEPDDHIAYEMEFVAKLCERELAALDVGDEAEASRLRAGRESFLREHLATWAFRWCDLVDENAATDFYRGLSLLARGFMSASLEATSN